MKSLITTLLTLGLLAPAGTTYAFINIDDMMEAAKNGNGTYVETSSSVSTGGQTAKGGEKVITGDAHASSYTEINAGSNGGEVKVKIETSENGNTKTEEYVQPIEKDEPVKVEARAESIDGAYTAEVKVNDEEVEPESKSETGAATVTAQIASASVAVESKISLLFSEKIPSFFKKFFGLFAWL